MYNTMICCFSPSPDNKLIYRVERLRENQVNRALSVERWLSGKGINAARAVASMNEEVEFVGFMGKDLEDSAPDILSEAGISPNFVFTKARTRSCITILDIENQSATELVEEAPPVEEGDGLEIQTMFMKALRKGNITAATFSGSIPIGCPANVFHNLIQICKRRSIPTVIDAAGQPLMLGVDACPDVVKVNADEFRAAYPMKDGQFIYDAVRETAKRISGTVVVSDGPNKVIFSVDGEECRSLQPPDVKVINPIGSGDAFTAGIALGLQRSYEMENAIRLGLAMATANTMTLEPGNLDPAMVDELYESLGST
jgi:tagatose 6-phosphate kinase